MILFLDTADFQTVRFVLIDEVKLEVAKEKVFQLGQRESNKIVGELNKFLPKSLKSGADGKSNKNFSKIIVVSGPGSFTGIRIGIAASLAMSLAWEVPVFAVERGQVPENLVSVVGLKKLKKVNQNFEPVYGAEPNITPAKNKVSVKKKV